MKTPIRIALADDDEKYRSEIKTFLQLYENCDVVIDAENGVELLNAIEQLPTPPDICLVDINMPVMDGYEVIAKLKKTWPSIHVMILSQCCTGACITQMMHSGAGTFLGKEGDKKELYEAIISVRYTGTFMSRAMKHHIPRQMGPEDYWQLPFISEQEFTFLKYYCSNVHLKDIAAHMSITLANAVAYKKIIFEKLKINSFNDLLIKASAMGIYVCDKPEQPLQK